MHKRQFACICLTSSILLTGFYYNRSPQLQKSAAREAVTSPTTVLYHKNEKSAAREAVTSPTTVLYHKNEKSAAREAVTSPTTVLYHKNESIPSTPTPVVIVTYARSGSTFLGDVIRQSGDVFYIFEPLYFMKRHSRSDTFHFIDGSVRTNISYLSEVEYVIRSIVTCNFIHLPLEFFAESFVHKHGYQLETFYMTYRWITRRRFSETIKFKAIVQSLDIQCRNAKVVVVKTIRTPLFILRNLFTDLKNFKVLHLVRDPRPTIMSQNVAIQRIKLVSKYAGNFCARILTDITISDILTTYDFPGQIVRIHYENLAFYPINMTMQVYKYLNLSFSLHVEKSVLNMTSSGKKEAGGLNTMKGNSTEVLYKWRNTANMKFVLDVDRQCFSVYERLGYVPVYNHSVLRNMSMPLFLNRNWKFEFGYEMARS